MTNLDEAKQLMQLQDEIERLHIEKAELMEGRIKELEQQVLERDALIETLLSFIREDVSVAAYIHFKAMTPSEALAAHDKKLLDEAFGEPVGIFSNGKIVLREWQNLEGVVLYRRKESA